jgi:hypothetical protein
MPILIQSFPLASLRERKKSYKCRRACSAIKQRQYFLKKFSQEVMPESTVSILAVAPLSRLQ